MKDYKTELAHGTLTITNKDENPLITSIECTRKRGEWQDSYKVKATFSTITKETEALFSKLPVVTIFTSSSKSFELSASESNKDDFISFFYIVQKLDRLSTGAYSKLDSHTGIDMTIVLDHEKMLQQLAQSDHEGAFDIAKKCVLNRGNVRLLLELAEYYKSKNDNASAITVLAALPHNSDIFTLINSEILKLLILQKPGDESQKSELLTSRFIASLNSQNAEMTSDYFSQLCGDDSLRTSIPKVNVDVATLLAIASEYKKIHAELEQLRAYKAQKETPAEHRPASPKLF